MATGVTGTDTVLLERRGPLALVTLNRPERRNALTVEMCARLYDVTCELAASDAMVVILRGAGADFCVGADVLGTPSGGPSPSASDLGPIHQAATLLHTMPAVTIAAIDGGCAGAGLGYALACDLRFATPRARFATAFLNVGVSGDMGVAWSLNRLIGPAKARELQFLPGKFGGEEALAMDLINRLHAPDQLHAEALAAAQALCERNPLALRHMKANCLSAETLPMAEFVAIETERHLECTTRPDFGKALAERYRGRSKG